MKILSRFPLLISVSLLTGCSVYQSDGRKFLEKQAFEFAGVNAAANVTNCGYASSEVINQTSEAKLWTLSEKGENTETYVSESTEFAMKVLTTGESPSYGCDFQFSSAQEMIEKSKDAAELTRLNYEALPKTR